MAAKGIILPCYRTMSPQDQITFRRWLWLNTFVGCILITGLLVMALLGSNAQPGKEVIAGGMTDKFAASTVPSERLSQNSQASSRGSVRSR